MNREEPRKLGVGLHGIAGADEQPATKRIDSVLDPLGTFFDSEVFH